MSDAPRPCQATTKAGTPCRNMAQAGTVFCHVHRNLAASAATAQLQETIAGVNTLAEDLHRKTPSYQPPPFSPQAMVALLQQQAERFAASVPMLDELRRNLEGTRPEDLIDPETWKGLWYILNYTAQSQSRQMIGYIEERLAALPGGQTLVMLKSGLEGTRPEDLLDVETWKGAFYILDATVKAQAGDLKRKVLGD